MKEKIAKWLLKLAKKLSPQQKFELADVLEPKKIGLGYHISKKDVRDYRKRNPQFKSHREALAALIEDTKREIIMNIMAGIHKHGLVDFKVNRTLYVADVIGNLYIYVHKEETE